MATIFNEDFKTEKTLAYTNGQTITDYLAVISDDVSESAIEKGDIFSNEINNNYVSDFEKKSDLMAHVSTFVFKDGYIYMTYYANTESEAEDPNCQTARFVICPENDLDNKKIIDIQTVGDECGGGTVEQVYDTILMQKDEDTFVILWTAKVSGNYYRLYRTYKISENRLGDVGVNRFKVGNITNDFSTSGIKSALAENGIPCKKTYADIGIMQKQSYRIENGGKYYYSGTYSGDFNCVIKSKDLITWEYVSQPDFPNNSKWENAVYVKNDRVYYFVRQQDHEKTGFLSYYDLTNNTWEKPVLIHDCQSRSDFIEYKNELYLFHAPKDREHIGIVKIDENNIKNSFAVAQSDIRSSCFYPFVEYGSDGTLYMSYTVDRKHIRLAKFDMDKIIK